MNPLQSNEVHPDVDDEETWRLCCEIHRRDPRATYGGDGYSTPRLVVPELQFEYFEKGILGSSDEIVSRIRWRGARNVGGVWRSGWAIRAVAACI
jgi:hypothetical protein